MSAPDMTPQGLSDAIDELFDDLPQRRPKAHGSWQRALTLQVLNTLFDASPEDPRLFALGQALWSVFTMGLLEVMHTKPALRRALVEAFDAERPRGGPEIPDTPFESGGIGKCVWMMMRVDWLQEGRKREEHFAHMLGALYLDPERIRSAFDAPIELRAGPPEVSEDDR